MPIEFTPLKTHGVYSKIFINDATRMCIKINKDPLVHMNEESDHFIDKISIREAAVLQKIGFHPNIITPKFISQRSAPGALSVFLPTTEQPPSPSQARLAIGMDKGRVSCRKKKTDPIPSTDQIATFLCHIANGLAYAHAADIAHRDVKPDNIVQTPEGIYQLIDWGLAGLAASEKQSESKKYVTRWYRPPELLDLELGKTDHRAADIWALAITTLEIFSSSSKLFASTAHTQLATAIYLSKLTPVQIKSIFCTPDLGLAVLLSQMLTRHPSSRITAQQILNHPSLSQYTPPPLSPPPPPLFSSSSSREKMPSSIRERMYEWLCGVWAYYRCDVRAIALFTAYEICDRYIDHAFTTLTPFSSYQVIGCASLSIADSLYDTWPLSHEDYVSVSGNLFTVDELEQTILSISEALDWNLYTPGVYLRWKTLVQDSTDIESIVSLAVLIANEACFSSPQIIERSLHPAPTPERFSLFPKLIKEKESPPSPTPLVF